MTLDWEMIALSLLFFWSLTLTFLFSKFYIYYRNLIKHSSNKNLSALLNDLFEKEELTQKQLKDLMRRYDKLERESLLHVQKIGLLRFNPFKDTGGDQSFILCLLDAQDSGVVISSLHTRSGTRWYAKKVMRGKGHEYVLSEDEAKAVAGARAVKN